MRRTFLFFALFPTAALAIEHGTFSVDSSGVATKTQGTAGFTLGAGAVAGEYPIQIGPSAADDAAGGVLFSSVAERGRIDATRVGGTQLQFAVGGTVADSDPNSINTRNAAGGLAVTTTRIGAAGLPTTPPTPAPNGGQPFGANFGAAYFPLSEGWITGTFSSSTSNPNGTFGALDTYFGAPGVTLDENAFGPGQHRLSIPGVSDPWSQGMLWVSTASNVGRFATAQPHPDSSGYWVSTPDNDGFFEFDPASDPDLVNEGDSVTTPFSFLFIPKGQTGLTAAVVNPSFTVAAGQPTDALPYFQTGSSFSLSTVDRVNSPGQFRLTINGGSPSQGTLLLNNAVQGISGDNALTYQADGDGWLITSEDIESNLLTGDTEVLSELDGVGQTHDLAIPYFNFLYVPNNSPATAAAPTPAIGSVTSFDRSRVYAWNTEVVAANNNNDPGDVFLNVTAKTPDASVVGAGNQRGDNSYAVQGRPLTQTDGVMLSTISQGLRDNTPVGGTAEHGVVGTNLFTGYWSVITERADGSPNGEHNIDHAVAFFGADSGFQFAANADIPDDTTVNDFNVDRLVVSLPGVNVLTDGVLMANSFGNDDNYLIAEPQADGSGWHIATFDNGSGDPSSVTTEPDAASWVYLPYDSENLIAGLVNVDGSLVSSTDGAGTEWSLVRENDAFGFPQYRLSVAGKSFEDGMLLLTSTGRFGNAENRDNSIIYERASNGDFLIRGLDHVGAEGFVDFQEAGFMFAYIDYANPPIAPSAPPTLPGDANGDGSVDLLDLDILGANFGALGGATVAQGDFNSDGNVDLLDLDILGANFGSSLSATAVPEPAGLVAALGLLAAAATRRRA